MQLKILNSADEYAVTLVAGLQNSRSLTSVLAEHALKCEEDEDFICIVAKSLLPASYQSNPSIFAIKLLPKTEGFKDCSGFQSPDNTVTISLLRQRKASNARRINPFPSVKAVIKEWLLLNLPFSKRLTIPIDSIPPFLLTHPEQLTYQVKTETKTPIKITKLSKSWLISRK